MIYFLIMAELIMPAIKIKIIQMNFMNFIKSLKKPIYLYSLPKLNAMEL